jgi:ribosomal protein S18 acetylase RimI-like enzyme
VRIWRASPGEAADVARLLGAPGDGPPAGVVGLRFRHTVWTDAEDCWIEDVFVEESARGGGLGRALVEAALARARERGCVRVDLDTQADNTRAIRLYESLGFHAETALLYMRMRL